MFKEAHIISYIQQANHKWIEGNEEEIIYTQVIKSLRVAPTNIQHEQEVLQTFKAAHKPLVKTLSSFENMESHGEPIKPILCQLIIWTPPMEGITLLKFFGGIGISFETLLQSRMVVGKYFYIDIDPIAKQMVALIMMEHTIQEHYMLVKHCLGELLLLDATQCNSYAHRLRNWWSNLAPLSVLQLVLRYTIRQFFTY